VEFVKLKAKDTIYKHCTPVNKIASTVCGLTVLILSYMFTETEQLNTQQKVGVKSFYCLSKVTEQQR
jgi:hypothetical protein